MSSPAETSHLLIVTVKEASFFYRYGYVYIYFVSFRFSDRVAQVEGGSGGTSVIEGEIQLYFVFREGRWGVPCLGGVPNINTFVFIPSAEVVVSKLTVVVLSGTISCLLRLKAAGTPVSCPLHSFIYSIPSTFMSSVTSRINEAGLNSRLLFAPSLASTSRLLMAIPYKGMRPDVVPPAAFVSG